MSPNKMNVIILLKAKIHSIKFFFKDLIQVILCRYDHLVLLLLILPIFRNILYIFLIPNPITKETWNTLIQSLHRFPLFWWDSNLNSEHDKSSCCIVTTGDDLIVVQITAFVIFIKILEFLYSLVDQSIFIQ